MSALAGNSSSSSGDDLHHAGHVLSLTQPAALIAEFTVPGEPVSKARARFTSYGSKVRSYTPAKTMEAERRIKAAYLATAEPCTDVDRAFGVVVDFLHETGQRRDVDNMLKAVLDGLNGVAFPDDVQVTHIVGTKRRVPKGEAETRVAIYNLGRIEKPRGRCVRCGTEFAQYASTSSRKYCTRECTNAHRKEARERNCLNCGTAFLARGVERETRYCGTVCTSEHKRVELACVQCGEAFTKPRSIANKGLALCSEECSRTYHREARKVGARSTCPDCAGPKSTKRAARCRGCHLANARWSGKHIRKES